MKSLIRRRVRHLIKKKSEQVDKFAIITDLSHNVIFRVIEKIITLVCIGFFCCQIWDVFRLHFSYPKTVSFAYEDSNTGSVKPLEIKLCESEIVRELYRSNLTTTDALLALDKRKDVLLISNIEVLGSSGHKISIYNNITLSNVIKNYNRICTTFDLGSIIAVKPTISINGTKASHVFLNDYSDYSVDYYAHLPQKLTLRLQKYNLLNTPKTPCTSDEEFKLCVKRCVFRRLKKHARCRIFTYPDDLHLPTCRTESDFIDVNVLPILYNLETYTGCGCVTSCNKLIIFRTIKKLTLTNHTDELSISSESMVTSVTEHAAYDTINLLTDIGGSMGLFIGLSTLSLFYFVYESLRWIKDKYKNRVQCLLDPKIEEVFDEYCHDKLKRSKWPRLYKFVVIALCKCLSIFLIQELVGYYFIYPTRNIIEVHTEPMIKFPDTIVCSISEQMASQRIAHAEKYNITNWWDVDLLDLLDENLTVQQLWDISLPFQPKAYPKELRNISVVHTRFGKCHRITYREKKFWYNRRNYLYVWYPNVSFPENCTEKKNQVFVDNIGSPLNNIIFPYFVPVYTWLRLNLRFQKIINIYTPRSPCNDYEIFVECARNCVLKALIAEKLCSLPYFPQTSNAPCDNSLNAKKSRNRFQEITYNVFYGKDRYCPPSCTNDVIHTTDELILSSGQIQDISITISTTTNIVDHIKQVRKYSLVSLLSDIGNILCITQNISILTILHGALYIISGLVWRINKHFNFYSSTHVTKTNKT